MTMLLHGYSVRKRVFADGRYQTLEIIVSDPEPGAIPVYTPAAIDLQINSVDLGKLCVVCDRPATAVSQDVAYFAENGAFVGRPYGEWLYFCNEHTPGNSL